MTKDLLLIVEDELLIANEISELLKELGFQNVKNVPSGEEALEIVAKEKPCLILMDIELKGKLNGIKTVHKIHEQHSDIAIIYLSKVRDSLTLNKMYPTNPESFIPKPFDHHTLSIAIQIALNKQLQEKKTKVQTNKKLLDDSFFVSSGNQEKRIQTKDVLYLKSQGSYCNLITVNGTHVLSINLSVFEEKVNQNLLVRVQRQFIINASKIVAFEGANAILTAPTKRKEDGSVDESSQFIKIPIGKKYLKELMLRFNRARSN